MKTRFLSVLAVTAILFVSCSVNDDINEGPGDGQVRFTADVGQIATAQNTPGSRAAGTNWTSGDKVGIFQVENGSTTALTGGNNKQYEITNDASGVLDPVDGTHLYYPTMGSVDFFAYYPYQPGMTGYDYQVNISNQSEPEKIDLLRAFADGAGNSGYDKTYSGSVALKFYHRLSKFIIKTEAGGGLTDLTGMNVTIKGIDTEVVYDISDDSFGATSSTTDLTPVVKADGQQYEAIVIPATSGSLGEWSVEFEVDGETYIWSVPASTFESGKEHTWTITVQKTPVGIQGTINDWRDGNGGTDVAE